MTACETPAPPAPNKAEGQALQVAPDTPQRVAQLPRTVIDYDRSLLNDNEKQVVAKLIEATKAIDELYWRQVSEHNPEWRAQLAKQGGAGYEYFLANKGPWDRLKENEPFAGTMKKPAGAAFYPEDITKEEFEKYVTAHPDQKEQLEGLFTVVRRDGAKLVARPYSFDRRLMYGAAGLPISRLVGESASVSSRIAKRCCSASFHSPLALSGTIDCIVERQTR